VVLPATFADASFANSDKEKRPCDDDVVSNVRLSVDGLSPTDVSSHQQPSADRYIRGDEAITQCTHHIDCCA